MTSMLRIPAESMRQPQSVEAQKTPWQRLRPDETQYRHPNTWGEGEEIVDAIVHKIHLESYHEGSCSQQSIQSAP